MLFWSCSEETTINFFGGIKLEYGHFENEGSKYVIETPKTPFPWYNCHYNKDYYLTVSQTAYGESRTINPYEKIFNREYRLFYICDGQEIWCPAYRPLKTELDEYKCEQELAFTRIISKKSGVKSNITAFVPLEGMYEIWQHKVENSSDCVKELRIISAWSLEFADMGPKCEADIQKRVIKSHVFPYYIKYEEYENIKKLNN